VITEILRFAQNDTISLYLPILIVTPA